MAEKKKTTEPILNMRPDPPDLRDRLYDPNLRSLPGEFNARPYEHPAWVARVRNQEQTSACTGFALAAMVEALTFKRWEDQHQQEDQPGPVSPFMLYYFARRYDELKSDDEEGGSTARGAMKAWNRHGACRQDLWPALTSPPVNAAQKKAKSKKRGAAAEHAMEADNWVANGFRTPLGAYYRVNPQSIPDIHAALNETGIVYVTAEVHEGWRQPVNGRIENLRGAASLGGHAFLLVGYDENGFWIQNSWGTEWGRNGFAHLGYTDWQEHGYDAWIGQLGVYITSHMDSLGQGLQVERADEARRDLHKKAAEKKEPRPNDPLQFSRAMLSSNPVVQAQQINPYIVNLENNGVLSNNGKFRTTDKDLKDLANFYLPNALQDWKLKETDPIDVALYAHGGLVPESGAAGAAATWIPALYAERVFPVFFMWETGLFDSLGNIIRDALGLDRPSAVSLKDRLLDFKDDRLESLVAPAGTPIWEEIKENGEQATENKNGGLRKLAAELNRLPPALIKRMRFHLIGHSAGAVFHAHLLPKLVDAGLAVKGIYFMAPACRVELFEQNILPKFKAGLIPAYTQFHMRDEFEQADNCAQIYSRSLLYLVSNAFERQRGRPILGMEKFVKDKPWFKKRPSAKVKVWDFVASPTSPLPSSVTDRSLTTTHGGFDNDPHTIRAILERIKRQPK